MSISAATSLPEMAFLVGTALKRSGVSAVLSGGGAATLYAPDVNQSRDLDFVLTFWSSLGATAQSLLDLGFRERNGGYEHPATRFTLEFPRGPLMIGSEVITEWSTLQEGEQVLQVITPTDSVRDRLAWFLFYRNADYAALEQALGVAARHPIDLDRIRDWAIREGGAERFPIFEARYRAFA